MRILKITIGIVASIVTLAVAVFLYASREPEYPPHIPSLSDPAWGIDEKVGWYEFGPDDRRLLSYAADGGLMMYAYSDGMHRSALIAGTDGAFDWRPEENTTPRSVRFEQRGDGTTTAMVWQDGKIETRATRVTKIPYAVEEIQFANGDVTLAATLFLPPGDGPHPAAVMIHGSGNSDRDNSWYTELADYLARHDVAVLFPDKRGTGKSAGTWQTSSFSDFAHDAIAAAKVMREQPGIDPDRVGLLGISQGGWIAPLAATLEPDIAFVIDLCGSTVTPREQLVYEERQTLRQQGLPGWLADAAGSVTAWYPQRVRGTWWKKNGDFDPIPYWRDCGRPSFIAYGLEDAHDNVPIDEVVARIETLQREHPEVDLTLKLYEGSGHPLQEPGKENIRFDFLDFMTTWIHEKSTEFATAADQS